jgi:hypothetical protein
MSISSINGHANYHIASTDIHNPDMDDATMPNQTSTLVCGVEDVHITEALREFSSYTREAFFDKQSPPPPLSFPIPFPSSSSNGAASFGVNMFVSPNRTTGSLELQIWGRVPHHNSKQNGNIEVTIPLLGKDEVNPEGILEIDKKGSSKTPLCSPGSGFINFIPVPPIPEHQQLPNPTDT